MPVLKGNKPSNKGRSQGQKKGFTQKQIQMIYDHLVSCKDDKLSYLRDLTLFCAAIDTMLRASDLLKLTVSDVLNDDGSIKETFPLQQKKTQEAHVVSITPRTQEILIEWIEKSNKKRNDLLFARIKKKAGFEETPISTNQYRVLVKRWAKIACVKDVSEYSTHSLRRTKSVVLWLRTHNAELIRQVLGQSNITATSHYLGLDKKQAIETARKVELFQ